MQKSPSSLTRLSAAAGCVIRGLNDRWVEPILGAAARTVAQSRRLEQQGKLERVDEGWITPDGTLFIPAAHDGTATPLFFST